MYPPGRCLYVGQIGLPTLLDKHTYQPGNIVVPTNPPISYLYRQNRLHMQISVRFLVILGILSFMWACQEDPEGPAAYQGPVAIEELKDSSIFLVCEEVTQASDKSKHHEVYITIGPNKVKVGEIEGCQPIHSSQYEALGIPAEALHALGDPRDPGASIVYITRVRGDLITVRKGLPQPDSMPPYEYRSLATFSNNELSPVADVNKADFVGVYTMETANKSFIFLIGMAKKNLSAHLYEINGALPTADQFYDALKGVEPIYLPGFSVDLNDLSFRSEMLRGQFTREGNKYVIQTEAWKGNNNQPLFLRPMEGK